MFITGGKNLREKEIRELINKIKSKEINEDEAVEKLKNLPFENLGYAKVDHHRSLRRGQPETIFCAGKSTEQIKGIINCMKKKHVNILATRAEPELFNSIKTIYPEAVYYENARIFTIIYNDLKKTKNKILIITAGTSDIPVAEEAAVTASVLGNSVIKLFDVGVSGIHRLLSFKKDMDSASVLIIVAGMDGALPSVVAGLLDKPVIAVPTSVGYGASFGGIAALLTMLNSCASGVTVVNIDNGYGAGYAASLINHAIEKEIK